MHKVWWRMWAFLALLATALMVRKIFLSDPAVSRTRPVRSKRTILWGRFQESHPWNEDCITEEKFCFETCEGIIEGVLGESTVELLADAPEELDCKQECINNTDCKFYAYHNESDPSYPQLCFLLTHLKEPLEVCSLCSTGSATCTVAVDS